MYLNQAAQICRSVTTLNVYKEYFRDALTSLFKASLELCLPWSTVHDVLHKGLKLQTSKLQLVQNIRCTHQDSRKQPAFPHWRGWDYLNIICFSDEATFGVSGKGTSAVYKQEKIIMKLLHMSMIHQRPMYGALWWKGTVLVLSFLNNLNWLVKSPQFRSKSSKVPSYEGGQCSAEHSYRRVFQLDVHHLTSLIMFMPF
jgi:hypothetical protein